MGAASYYYLTSCEFFTLAFADGLSQEPWEIANFLKSSGLFSVFWPILKNIVVWMASDRPLISVLSSLFSKPWRSFQAHRLQLVTTSPSCARAFLVLWLGSSIFYLFAFFFIFLQLSAGTTRSIRRQILFFLLINIISRTDSDLCILHLFAWSDFKLLYNSQWLTFPTQSCLVLYFFCAS